MDKNYLEQTEQLLCLRVILLTDGLQLLYKGLKIVLEFQWCIIFSTSPASFITTVFVLPLLSAQDIYFLLFFQELYIFGTNTFLHIFMSQTFISLFFSQSAPSRYIFYFLFFFQGLMLAKHLMKKKKIGTLKPDALYFSCKWK